MEKLEIIEINGKEYSIDGDSAYEIAVQEGFEGTKAEWLASLKGKTPTIRIGAVVTASPNTPANVENTGTAEKAVFNFVIPQGKQGDAYTLTDTDKTEIAEQSTNDVLAELEPILENLRTNINAHSIEIRALTSEVYEINQKLVTADEVTAIVQEQLGVIENGTY